MNNYWLTQAISNNAHWCSAIASSHGVSSQLRESIWFTEEQMPPFYANIVTLNDEANINDSIERIDASLQSRWALKDSFKSLQLEDKGFAVAFDAYWYCLMPRSKTFGELKPSTQVQRVTNPFELNRWEQAWGEGTNIFKPSLLLDNSIGFVFKENDGDVVAGLATNQSGESVGISNTFGLPEDIQDCVKSVIKRYSSKAVVGYGDKEELALLSEMGFQEIGELRIWIKR